MVQAVKNKDKPWIEVITEFQEHELPHPVSGTMVNETHLIVHATIYKSKRKVGSFAKEFIWKESLSRETQEEMLQIIDDDPTEAIRLLSSECACPDCLAKEHARERMTSLSPVGPRL